MQLAREPLPLPQLILRRRPDSIFDYRYRGHRDRRLPVHPPIKAPIAV